MNLRLYMLALIGSLYIATWAQVDDSVTINTIIVTGAKSKYTPGIKIETISSELLETDNSGNLASIIAKYSPIYVRSLAGGLSTISIRGTKPDHTGIYVDGINFNSLTLGHTNASTIPIFFFDELQVQYGGASALYGSDVIGGSIHLISSPILEKGVGFSIQQKIGSFHSSFSGLKFRIGNGKLESSTKVLFNYSRNDFYFINKTETDADGYYVRQRQPNAAYKTNAVLQECFYKIDKGYYFVKLLFVDEWHQSQPNMSSSVEPGVPVTLSNKNTKLYGGVNSRLTPILNLSFRSAFVNDNQLYAESEQISTSRISNQASVDILLPVNSSFKIGGQHKYIWTDIDAYDRNLFEHQLDVYLSYVQRIRNSLDISINIRDNKISGKKPHLSPSIGITQKVNIGNGVLSGNLFVSKNLKIPSFNDRYWPQVGNPDLKNEKSTNGEFALKFQNKAFKAEINLYKMDVNDWIQWKPDDNNSELWYPINYQNVISKGFDISIKHSHSIGKFNCSYYAAYNYNSAVQVKAYNNDSASINMQLPYVPKHSASGFINVELEKYKFSIDGNYTGNRVDDDNNSLESYLLVNQQISRSFKLGKSELQGSFKINNITNKRYMNIYQYAMPGVNWQIELKYKFN